MATAVACNAAAKGKPMDVFDKLALQGRRYDQQRAPRTGSLEFTLGDVLQTLGRNAILELTATGGNGPDRTLRPDPVRKLKVSLLDDGITSIHSGAGDSYHVYRTAPSGDLSKVRIVALSTAGAKVGEIRMLMGRRTYDHYFKDDPLIEQLRSNTQ
jgi:hypothetical protein